MPKPLDRLPPHRFDYWHAQHLLSRAGFGGPPAEVRALADLGLEGAVDALLDPELDAGAVSADTFDANIMRPRTPEEQERFEQLFARNEERARELARRERQQRQRADRAQIKELQRWWLDRLIEAPDALREKLTLFWHGHFATGYRAIEDSWQMFRQNQFFRVNALGPFTELAAGIIRDPAMLRYLNNNQNRRANPNENLARELMELFTMGEGNGYTELDIREGARALTGYTYDDNDFAFRERDHDTGTKRIFGSSGTWNGDDFIRLIFDRRGRQVAEYLSLKLYRFFVNDLPGEITGEPRTYIQKLAGRMRTKGWSVRETLRTVFMSAHFYDDVNVAAQIKSPVQLIAQSIRSLGAPRRSSAALVEASAAMGQELFFPPSVKGWDGGRSWINTSTLYVRQNLPIFLFTGQRPAGYSWKGNGASFDAMHLVEHLHALGDEPEPRDVVIFLLRVTLGKEPQPERIETLTHFIERSGGRITNDLLIALLVLVAAMPEFQLC